MNRTFLFQVNVTRDCNLRCTHCYISTDKKVQSKYMTKDQFLKVFDQISEFLNSQYAKIHNYNYADIHVIGGEPTLLGYEFFKDVLPVIKLKLNEINIKYKLSIVSNLLTKEAFEVVKLFDEVSTSYEVGTRFVSHKGVQKPAMERLWLHNVKNLQAEGRNVALTMAVTRKAIDEGVETILDTFYLNGFKNIHLGFFIPSGDGKVNQVELSPSFLATSKFLISAADWYIKKRDIDKLLFIYPIESLIEAIYYNRPSDDIVCPIIPGALDIDWDGETVTCIEAGGEVNMNSLGNIFDESISKVISGRKYIRERNKAIIPQKNCVGCDELDLCQSACSVLHKQWSGNGECPGFKRFIKYIRGLVDGGLKPKSMSGNNFTGC